MNDGPFQGEFRKAIADDLCLFAIIQDKSNAQRIVGPVTHVTPLVTRRKQKVDVPCPGPWTVPLAGFAAGL